MSPLRAKYAKEPAREKPFFIDRRSWALFVEHVYGGETFQAVGLRAGVSAGRAKQIVYKVDHDLSLPRHSHAEWVGITEQSPLEDLELSIRARHILLDMGCRTVGDLLRADLSRSIRHLGRTTRHEISHVLASHGFHHSSLGLEENEARIERLSKKVEHLKTRIEDDLRALRNEVRGLETQLKDLAG